MKMLHAAGAAWLVLLAAAPVTAHHSYSTEYDRTKPESVTGVVMSSRFSSDPCQAWSARSPRPATQINMRTNRRKRRS